MDILHIIVHVLLVASWAYALWRMFGRQIRALLPLILFPVLRRGLAFGMAEKLLDAGIQSPVTSRRWNRLRVLCRIMSWPLSMSQYAGDTLTVVEHPTRGLVYGSHTTAVGMPAKRLAVDVFQVFGHDQDVLGIVDALMRPDMAERLQGLAEGVSLLVPEDLPLTGHARLNLSDRMRHRSHSAGQVVVLPGITRNQRFSAELFDACYVAFRRGPSVILLAAKSSVLDRLLEPTARWDRVWTDRNHVKMTDLALFGAIRLPNVAVVPEPVPLRLAA